MYYLISGKEPEEPVWGNNQKLMDQDKQVKQLNPHIHTFYNLTIKDCIRYKVIEALDHVHSMLSSSFPRNHITFTFFFFFLHSAIKYVLFADVFF